MKEAKATLPSDTVPPFAPFLRPNAPSSLEPPGNRGSAPTRALASFSNLEVDAHASDDSIRLVPGSSRGQPGGTVETALVPQFHSGPLPPLQILRGAYAPHDHNARFYQFSGACAPSGRIVAVTADSLLPSSSQQPEAGSAAYKEEDIAALLNLR